MYGGLAIGCRLMLAAEEGPVGTMVLPVWGGFAELELSGTMRLFGTLTLAGWGGWGELGWLGISASV